MRALSIDTRVRIVEAYNDGEGTYEDLAERFKCGRATVNRYLRRDREALPLAAKPNPGKKPLLDEEDLESIHFIILAQPDITLERMLERFVEDGGRRVSIATLHRAVNKLGLTRKKSPSKRRSGSAKT